MSHMAEHPASPALVEPARRLARAAAEGRFLSDEMAKMGRVFSRLQVGMVEAGEKSGGLVETLALLAKFADEELSLRQQLRAQTFYVKIVVVFFILTVAIVANFLPYAANLGYVRFVLVLGTMALLLWPTLKIMKWAGIGEEFSHTLALTAPMFAHGNRLAATSKFLYGVGFAYRAGIPVSQAMELAAEATGNVVFAQSVAKVSHMPREGVGIAQALEYSGILDPSTLAMMQTAELSGTVDVSTERLARHYHELAVIELGRNYRVLAVIIGGLIMLAVAIWIILFWLSYMTRGPLSI